MKKLFTLLSATFLLLSTFTASAQICTANAPISVGPQANPVPGFGNVNNLPCIVRYKDSAYVIPFKVFSTFSAQGNTVSIDTLVFDSITNLPCGLCYATGGIGVSNFKSRFAKDEEGFIRISGLTNELAGQYELNMFLRVRTPNGYLPGNYNSKIGGIRLWIRVTNAGTACAVIDTANHTVAPAGACTTKTSIEEATNTISTLSITPNPMANSARVSFIAETSGDATVKIINMVGSEVMNSRLAIKAGSNETMINRNNLSDGVYFLSISTARGTVTKKFVISE